jgi:hypothetical protein
MASYAFWGVGYGLEFFSKYESRILSTPGLALAA